MEPKEQFHVMKQMRDDGTKMLAIYHSHPDFSAYPSAKDVYLSFYSDSAYVIVSLKDKVNPDIRAFEIVEGKVSEISIGIRR
jgi:proteasome lid subunit RPN8/RPN11